MKRILALIDFSPITPALVKIARDMARAFNSELILLHVLVATSELARDEARHDVDSAVDSPQEQQRQMDVLKLTLAKVGINATAIVARDDRPGANPVTIILDQIACHAPDMIVIGSHGHGRLRQLLAGSTSDAVIRKASCPVILVPFRLAEGASV